MCLNRVGIVDQVGQLNGMDVLVAFGNVFPVQLLACLAVAVLRPRYISEVGQKIGHLGAEVGGNILERRFRVLDGIVQIGSSNHSLIVDNARYQRGNAFEVHCIRIARVFASLLDGIVRIERKQPGAGDEFTHFRFPNIRGVRPIIGQRGKLKPVTKPVSEIPDLEQP